MDDLNFNPNFTKQISQHFLGRNKMKYYTLLILLVVNTLSFCQDVDSILNNKNTNEQLELFINLPYDILIKDFKKSEKWIEKLLPEAEKNKNYKAELLGQKSIISYYLGKYEQSTKEKLSSIKIFEDLKNYSKVGGLYASLGHQLKRINLNQGEYYMLKGIAILEKEKDSNGLSAAYNNYGYIKELGKQYDSAFYYYKKSLEIDRLTLDSIGIPYALNNIAGSYIRLNDFSNALAAIEESTTIRKLHNNYHGMAENYTIFGDLYLHFKQYKLAEEYYQKSLQQSKEIKYPYLIQYNLEQLAKTYSLLNLHQEAFDYFKNAQIIKDSLLNEKSNRQVAELQTIYETEKKDEEIAHQKEVIEKEKIINYFLYTLVAFLVIIAFSFYLWYRAKQQQKLQKALIKEKEKNIESVIYAQEEERQRIAKDLHDGIIQQLTSLKFGLKKIFENNEDENSKKIFSQLEESTSELRNISHQMMPKALNDLGVVAAIEDMLNKSLNPVNINFNFETFGITERLKQNIEITLFRVCQELINNIIKHSKANQASVQLFKSGNNIMLIVEDNGIGMNTSKISEGIGLMNISSRLDTVSGKVNFEPSPNSGTLATVKIPLQ